MYLKTTQCCAIQEIDGLSYHANAKEAMLSFCKQNFVDGVKYNGTRSYNNALYSFYLFTAALLRDAKPYGSEFAEFIKENNLGEVWASPKRVNEAFHPDHSNQVWVWMPNPEKLCEWWMANKPAEKPTFKSKAVKIGEVPIG